MYHTDHCNHSCKLNIWYIKNKDLATASRKSPVATYEKIDGARYGKLGLPWIVECAITFPRISKTPVKICSLLYTQISRSSGPVKRQKGAVPWEKATKSSVKTCVSTPPVSTAGLPRTWILMGKVGSITGLLYNGICPSTNPPCQLWSFQPMHMISLMIFKISWAVSRSPISDVFPFTANHTKLQLLKQHFDEIILFSLKFLSGY